MKVLNFALVPALVSLLLTVCSSAPAASRSVTVQVSCVVPEHLEITRLSELKRGEKSFKTTESFRTDLNGKTKVISVTAV